MNKFDEFVEAADKELQVDTSTRHTAISISSPSPSTLNDSSSILNSPSAEAVSRKELKVKQLSPKKLNHEDHPLRDNHGNVGLSPCSRSTTKTATVNRRRSLLQPVVSAAPRTPDKNGGGSSWNSNNTTPNGTFNRQASVGHMSVHSRSSSQSFVLDSTFDASLQNLANKELELLESKRRIEELKKQLHFEEKSYHKRVEDLNELKSQVSNDLHVNSQQQQQQQQPFQKRDETVSQDSGTSGTVSNSVWSKPLAFFNQFDQIIQQELEKSLNWDETPEDKIMHPQPYEGANGVQHNQLLQLDFSGLNNGNGERNNRKLRNNSNGSGDGAKNIWSFFNDVKVGLMGVDEETPRRTIAGSVNAAHGTKGFKTTKKGKDPVEMTDFRT